MQHNVNNINSGVMDEFMYGEVINILGSDGDNSVSR